ALVRAAVATSGDTSQFAVIDGVRYSHVVDPRTGEALSNRLCCTVVADTGMAADAFATALRVSGPDAGQYWLAEQPLRAVYFDAPGLTAPLPGCTPGEWQPLLAAGLSGWEAVDGNDPPRAPAEYPFAGGVLSIPAAGPGGSLRTKAEYRDFRLSLDFTLARMANSGLFLRGARAGGDPAFSGCEIQLLDDFDWETVTGTTLKPWQFSGSLYGSTAPAMPDALNPIGRWNTLDVRYQGTRLAVALNGRLLYDVDTRDVPGDPPFERRAPAGFLGLQRYAAPHVEGDTAVWVANLVVQEL
ncbi:MAG TPA: family 16 glycoside hydrolase, partial [Planctomycetota bacterium]|nr:family 16 glycoside hydrolase [Planctomycetota bacterium]